MSWREKDPWDMPLREWLLKETLLRCISVRTAAATVASLLTARLFHLPETSWAAITTMVVMRSPLGAAHCDKSARTAYRFGGIALRLSFWCRGQGCQARYPKIHAGVENSFTQD